MAIKAIPPHSREGVLEGTAFSRTWSKFFEDASKRIGGAKGYNLGGLVDASGQIVGNVGTSETNLLTSTLEKNTLNNAGDVLEVMIFGTTAANANNKTIKFYFGGTAFVTVSGSSLNNVQWVINITIIRTGASSQTVMGQLNIDGGVGVTASTSTEDFTVSNLLRTTGQGLATGDVVQAGQVVKAFPIT